MLVAVIINIKANTTELVTKAYPTA
jgi:hypothetical protein